MTATSVLLLLSAISAYAQSGAGQQGDPLQFVTKTLPDGIVGEAYETRLTASGGLPPYAFVLEARSKLPPGLSLSRDGWLRGTPTQPGEYSFVLELHDTGPASGWVQKEFKITIRAAFAVVWQKGPAVVGNQIVGQVVVFNAVNDPVDLTVIVVAVNEFDKAFALGYQRLNVGPQSQTSSIPFGSNMNLPYGRYAVHVDAVGEVAPKNRIYRARQQTDRSLVIAVP